jgi:hypothetical protein
MSDLVALRRQAVNAHGLPPEAVTFLGGSTLAELEESAAALAKLIGERRVEERTTAQPGPFTDMAAAKARRKQQLAAIFTGRTPQRRDEHGRFAADFHGGARQSAPLPPETHETTLMRLLRTGEANAGGRGI